ncbi:MAG TPA: hypothetical protein VL025_20965 [Thermoanaerobaculia bacterium]|nr:hypothetical protein [Thermoanaerobaculia bacterium]
MEEARDVVRHLLTRCPRCTDLATRKARELGIFGAAANVDQASEEVFARALSFGTEQAERLAVERLRAWGLWASLEGRIAAGLGDLHAAEHIFTQLWEELRARDLNHELVLLSIDLAETLVRNGEPNRAAELVAQCYPIMAAWGLHRYALSAWLVLEDAIGQQQAGSIFQRIREYYRRHWVNPEAFQWRGTELP